MSLLVPWLAFPILLAVLALGFGLLVEALAGGPLHGALLLPVGFAGVIVVSDLTTLSGTTARLAVPLVVVLAVVGFALAALRGRLRLLRLDPWAAAAAVAVFAVYAAPVVMLGRATFAGYASLDDTAQWFSLIDRVMSHGRNVTGLPFSTYQHLLRGYLRSGYPIGSMIPLGVGARLVSRDVAWVFQPYLAFQAVLLSLGLWVLLAGPIRSRGRRAAAVFVAAQPALLYGYALWGSIKEVVTTPLLPLLAVLVARALREAPTPRALVPLAVASAALLAVLNLPGGVWLLPALLPLAALVRRMGAVTFAKRTGILVGVLVLLALPALATGSAFTRSASGNLSASAKPAAALGELTHPLSALQLLGIWPVGDFRDRPATLWPTLLVLLVVAAAAAFGLVTAIRRRAFAVPAYVLTALAGWLIVRAGGSPWTVGKALATASPALLTAAFAGVGVLATRGRAASVAAGAAALAIAGGVLWSNALAYGGARLAPSDQLAELQQIGTRFDGQGPSLMTEFQPYGVRHFLRGLAVIQLPDKNLDALGIDTVEAYRTLVLDRSPLESRPPANYRLAWAGRFYDVWQRVPSVPAPLAHVGLGAGLQPTGTLACTRIESLAKTASNRHGALAAVLRPAPLGFELGSVEHPAGWSLDPATHGVYPSSGGMVRGVVDVGAAGRYRVWIGGYTPGKLTVTVDGRPAGSLVHRIELPGQYYGLDWLQLTRGRHTVVLDYTRPLLQPGSTSGVALLPMGPFVLARTTEDLPVRMVAPAQARTLCGRSLDWVEVTAAGH